MFRFGRNTANRLIRRNTSVHNRLNKSQRLILDKLEERTVPATYTVLNAADTGADSLRDILSGGKGALVAGDVINFDTTFFATSQTISLDGQLPNITVPLTIQPTGAAVGHVTLANIKAAGTTSRIFNITGGNGTTIDGLTLTGGNATTAGGAIALSAATVTLSNMTITGNKTTSTGGAVSSSGLLTVNNSVFSNNSAGSSGGAVYTSSSSSAALTVADSTFSNNTASGSGGAIYASSSPTVTVNTSTLSGNSSNSQGGAIYMNSGGLLSVTRSTLSNNRSNSNGGAISSWTSSVNVTSSTLAGNSAGGVGGAMRVGSSFSTYVIRNTTISSNTAVGAVGGVRITGSSGTVTIDNSIIAGNASNVATVSFDLASGTNRTTAANNKFDYSIIGTTDSNSITYTDNNSQYGTIATPLLPGLFPLGSYGGPTQTMMPKYNSPAIDKGLNSQVSITVDQQGNTRTVDEAGYANATGGDGTDIGSVEGFLLNPFYVSNGGLVDVNGGSPSTYTFSVTFESPNGVAAFVGGELQVVHGSSTITPAIDSQTPSGTQRTVNFSFTAPGGSWDINDFGTYTISSIAGKYSDSSNGKTNFAETIGSFKAAGFTGPVSLKVDEATDVNDGDYSTGKLSFREAIALTGAAVGGVDSITFDATVFSTNKTIDISANGQFTIAEDLSVTGPAAGVTFDAKNKASTRIFNLTDGTAATISVTMSNMTLTGGNNSTGSAIYTNDENITLDGFTITGNSAGPAVYLDGLTASFSFKNGQINNTKGVTSGGAAIRVQGLTSTTSVTLDNSSFTGNTTTSNGGVMYTNYGAVIAISNSTLYANSAGGSGGVLASWGGSQTTTANIVNSTLYGNTAGTYGGAIAFVSSNNTFTVQNSTIAKNSAGTNGGGIGINNATNTLTINSTIVAENLRGSSSITQDIWANGVSIAGDFNLVRIADGITFTGLNNLTGTDAAPQDAGFAKFGYQGGPSYMNVLPLVGGSAAIDKGNNAYGAGTYDQRGTGFNRTVDEGGYGNAPGGDGTDIGAFEGFLNIPIVSLVSAPPMNAPAATHVIQVAYNSANGFNAGTFGTDDITVTVPGIGALTTTLATPAGGGNAWTVTYTLDTSAVTALNNGSATVSVNAAAVTDNASINAPAGSIGNFVIGIGALYVVNATTDADVGSGLTGDIRYVINKANASIGALDTITFDSSIDGSTIQLGTQLFITDAVVITGNGSAKTIIKGGGFGMTKFDVTGSSGNVITVSGMTLTGGTSGNAVTVVDEDVQMTDVSITGNSGGPAVLLSGAVAKFSAAKSTISNNTSNTAGGAIRIDPNATTNVVAITDSTVSGNKASGSGGAIYINWGGTVNVSGSSLYDNSSSGSGGVVGSYNGVMTFNNSTLYRNTAGSNGGAIALLSTSSAVTFNNSTVAGNTAKSSGGGIARNSSGAGDITLNSTIVATNVSAIPDLYSSVVYSALGDYSLVGVADVGNVTVGGFYSLTGTLASPLDPGFGAFKNYGGLTNTLPLSKGSPALDKGSNSFGVGSYDQRGNPFSRTIDEAGVGNAADGTDMGAFEGIGPDPTAKLTTSPGTITVAGATPNTLVVTYYDDVAVKVADIGITNITITGAKIGALAITGAVPSPNADSDQIAVTYTFTVPGGAWDWTDNDTYTVAMVGSEVGDGTTDVAAGTLGTFQVAIANNFVVNATNDEAVDGDGKTSLREAILAANASANTSDSITFDAGVFAADTTISLSVGSELLISDVVNINNTTGKKITVSGNATSRVFNVNVAGAGKAVSMSNLIISGGKTTSGGAGINMTDDSLTLSNVTVSGNSAGLSGGGVALTTGTLVATGSTFSNNTTNSSGGGIFASSSSATLVDLTEVTVNGNTAATSGGGVSIGLGTLNITRSTISRNRANGTTTNGGGGISIGSSTTGTTFNMTNSTVSDNSAPTGTGGGVRVLSAPTMTTVSSTVVANSAGVNGGGFSFNADNLSGVSFQSSIVADNVSASPADQDFYVPTVNLVLLNGNYNLYGVADSPSAPPQGPNDIYGFTGTPVSAKLAPLGFYGGPTETRPLGKGSPALDAGFNYSALSTDQRGTGFPRIIDAAAPNANDGTDIGAVEGTTPIPIASLAAALQNVPPANTPYTFDVVYDDDLGIDTTTIDSTDVSVAKPGSGFISGISVTNINASNPQSVTVTYSFNAPGGSWDVTENGSYTVSVNAGAVSDIDVPVHLTGATTLGAFNVSIIGTITVDSTADGIDNDYSAGKLTLREAVALSNGTAGGGQVINFDATVFASMQTITLAGSGLVISQPVTVNGPSALVTVSGANSFLPFNVSDGTTTTINVSISNMVITQGKSSTGGGIRLDGESLTLNRVWLDANTASSGSGGGILMVGVSQLTLNSGAITNNSASSGGGILWVPGSTLVVSNSTMSGNTASGTGGAISGSSTSGGSIQLRNSTITNNKSGSNGGAIRMTNAGYSAGIVNIVSTILSGNTSSNVNDADIYGYDITSTNSIIGGSNTITLIDGGGTNKGGNPMLLPLANMGGVIPVHPLASPASAAFDQGSNPDALAFDQRGTGNPRLIDDPLAPNGFGDGTDMGAFELDNTKPYVSATNIPAVPPTTNPYEFTIEFSDNVGIKGSSIGTGDIEIVGPDGSKYTPTLKTPVANGSPVTSTWQFTPPGGSWDPLDNGNYAVNIVGTIEDLDGTTHTVATGLAGTIKVGIDGNLIVDNTGDAVDFNYTANNLTLREAILLSNTMSSANTISFSPSVFAGAVTIAMTGAAYGLAHPMTIAGTGAGKLTIDAQAGRNHFNVDVPLSTKNAISLTDMTLANGLGGISLASSIQLVDEALSLTGVVVTGGNGGPAVLMKDVDATFTGTSVTFSNNNNPQTSFTQGGGGAAIHSAPNNNFQVITLTDSTLSGNTAAGPGGAIYFVWNGTLNVERTTFSSNSSSGDGGAIAMYTATGTIKNSTFGNNASADTGGAIILQSSATLSIYNSTIGKNSATTGGGLADTTGSAGYTLDSTIVSQNSGDDLSTGSGIYADFSLISNTAGGGTITGSNNKLSVSAGLTTLANNGGPTQTFAITNLSPAYNAGRNSLGLTTDQRGSSRKSGGQEDIGAFELQVTPPPTATVTLDSGGIQRSMIQSITVNFSEAVTLGVAPFSVTRLKTSTIPNQAPYVGLDAPVILSVAGSGSTYTITFNDPTYAPTVGAAKSLMDGLYSVSLNASDITSTGSGLNLDGDGNGTGGDNQTTGFHRLFGDINGDGFTDNVDLVAFRTANGSTGPLPPYDAGFDVNGDNFIDNNDLLAFRDRIGDTP